VPNSRPITFLGGESRLQVVESLFGIKLPGVTNRLDLESVLDNPEFYSTVVHEETTRALAAVGGDTERLVPWLDTGTLPHNGDPMPAGSLRRIIEAAHGAGLRCMNYHHHGNSRPVNLRASSMHLNQS
jgi:hypothetical protein